MFQPETQGRFDSISLKLASPHQIYRWANIRFTKQDMVFGSVQSGETLHYMTLKPVFGGLFCERIFGPVKNFQCHCGSVRLTTAPKEESWCDKCTVQITRATARRYRFGDIPLGAPVLHIWYRHGIKRTNPLWRFLFLSKKQLARILDSKDIVIVEPTLMTPCTIFGEPFPLALWQNRILLIFANSARPKYDIAAPWNKGKTKFQEFNFLGNTSSYSLYQLLKNINLQQFAKFAYHRIQICRSVEFLCKKRRTIHLMQMKLGVQPTALFQEFDDLIDQTQCALATRKRFLISFKFAVNCLECNTRPEWVFLLNIPVIPPDLRPILKLEDGNLASADVNDLYRLLIYRNTRLRHFLVTSSVPLTIIIQEMRLVQTAVDAIFDNRRLKQPQVRTVMYEVFEPLRSLSDRIVGKTGRFRQNLLGKRVDYSGRSVIIVGPTLRLWECGLPYEMAHELFKPLFYYTLYKLGYINSIQTAKIFIARYPITVNKILSHLVASHPILLNRAPTLHRMGIQAFFPKLIAGRAIQLHPFVCPAFNADFDGDQMAVHIPIRPQAISEARLLMLAPLNWLSPATGEPSLIPSQDIVLGIYYLTLATYSPYQAKDAYTRIHSPIWICQQKVDGYTSHGRGICIGHHQYAPSFNIHFVEYEKPLQCFITSSGYSYVLYPSSVHIENTFAQVKQQYILTTVGRTLFHTYLPDTISAFY